MTAQTLLHDLATAGVILSANGDRLDVDGPEAALTDDLLATLRERKAELLALLNRQATEADDAGHLNQYGENVEEHDSALVIEANARELLEELRGAGCSFWTVEGRPRLYYPRDLAGELRDRVAATSRRDIEARHFRRLAREDCAQHIHDPAPVEVDYYTGERIRIPQDSTPAGWEPKF